MTRASLLLLLSLLITAGLAQAETVYISGAHRVGVRAEEGSTSVPLEVAVTGDALELLEDRGAYWRVRTAKGTEGWIKSIYAARKAPAPAKSNSTIDEQAVHETEQTLAQLQSQLEQQLSENHALQDKVNTLNTEIYNLHQSLSDMRGEDPSRHRDWLFLFIALAALAGLGFTLGILWNKHQVAKKLGGHSL